MSFDFSFLEQRNIFLAGFETGPDTADPICEAPDSERKDNLAKGLKYQLNPETARDVNFVRDALDAAGLRNQNLEFNAASLMISSEKHADVSVTYDKDAKEYHFAIDGTDVTGEVQEYCSETSLAEQIKQAVKIAQDQRRGQTEEIQDRSDVAEIGALEAELEESNFDAAGLGVLADTEDWTTLSVSNFKFKPGVSIDLDSTSSDHIVFLIHNDEGDLDTKVLANKESRSLKISVILPQLSQKNPDRVRYDASDLAGTLLRRWPDVDSLFPD